MKVFTMSNLAKSRSDSNATFSFTLPISCQICLGKVKQPVVCPNHHVFCKTCMELWLDHSPQCPACRVPITIAIPILGGLASQEETEERFSCKELRKARVELLFKEYETELERLQSENQMLQLENRAFRERLKDRDAGQAGSSDVSKSGVSQAADMATISRLTKKLEDATSLYEKVKKEMGQLKRDNAALKDEKVTMQSGNQNLRMELQGRSPRKYGRTTVAVLENKVESYEKEISQLKKALERSDSYIEDIEKELETLRRGKSHDPEHGHRPGTLVTKKQGDSFELQISGEKFGETASSSVLECDDPSFRKDKSDRKDERDVPIKNSGKVPNDTTFDLEMPSPFNATSTSAAQNTMESGHHSLSKDTFDDSDMAYGDTGKCRKKLRFMSQEKPADLWKDPTQKTSVGNTMSYSVAGTTHSRSSSGFTSTTPHKIGAAPNSLNVSMTPEIEDCLRLFDEAEKKIEKRRGAPDFTTMSMTSSLPLSTSAAVNHAHGLTTSAHNSGANFSDGNFFSSLPISNPSYGQSMTLLNQVPDFTSGNVQNASLFTRGQHLPSPSVGHNISNVTDQTKSLSMASGALTGTSGNYQDRMLQYSTQLK